MATAVQGTDVRSDYIESFNPATGEKLGQVKISSPADVEAAITRARPAQKIWWDVGAAGRNQILNRLRQVMLDRADEIARTISSENGKPRNDAVSMILTVCEAVKFYTKIAKKIERGVKVSPTSIFLGAKARIYYEPLGVAGFIMPWNFPFELGMKHMVPALAAGNACVQKPSEFNPLIGELIGSLYRDAGVPEGLVQIVHGYADVGVALIDNADVICFVGSPRTGKKIMERASQRLIPVVLELGGNDAAIVRRDADLDKAAQGIVHGACFNAGQVCNSIERVYAHKDIVQPLTEKIVALAKELKQNTGDDVYDLGPIKWPPQRKTYETHVADAVQKGAKVLTGGKIIEANGGAFWPPTVLANVNHTMETMKDETFGPFIPIMSVDSDEEAIRLANDSTYGLGGSVWTRDEAAGEAIARKMRTGSVVINNALAQAGCITLPFGGNGDSGVGRSWAEAGFFNYTFAKGLLAMKPIPKLMWMPYGKHSEKMMLGFAKLLNAGSLGKKFEGLREFIAAFRGK